MQKERKSASYWLLIAAWILATAPVLAGELGRRIERPSAAARGKATVTLPAGSVDALAAAIADAGPGGTVIVESGVHFESTSVSIDAPVTIMGEAGAILEADTTQGAIYPVAIDPLFYVHDTSDVTIEGLLIRPRGDSDVGAAVAVENASDVTVAGNRIERHQFGVVVQRGDRIDVSDNEIVVSLTWADGQVLEAHGVVVINGERARIKRNHISNPVFGIWACDRLGHASHNELVGPGLTGLILCNVPAGNFMMPSGDTSGSDRPATRWHASQNDSSGFLWGYMITDGSTENVVVNNAARDNLDTDIEILGDSYLFGFFTPTSTDNVVSVGKHKKLRVRDCGVDSIIGGNANLVDTDEEPCLCPALDADNCPLF